MGGVWRPVVPLGKGNTTPTSPTPSSPIPHPADWLPGLCAGPLKVWHRQRNSSPETQPGWRGGGGGCVWGQETTPPPAAFTSNKVALALNVCVLQSCPSTSNSPGSKVEEARLEPGSMQLHQKLAMPLLPRNETDAVLSSARGAHE